MWAVTTSSSIVLKMVRSLLLASDSDGTVVFAVIDVTRQDALYV